MCILEHYHRDSALTFAMYHVRSLAAVLRGVLLAAAPRTCWRTRTQAGARTCCSDRAMPSFANNIRLFRAAYPCPHVQRWLRSAAQTRVRALARALRHGAALLGAGGARLAALTAGMALQAAKTVFSCAGDNLCLAAGCWRVLCGLHHSTV